MRPHTTSLLTLIAAFLLPSSTAFSCSTTTASKIHYNLNQLTGIRQDSIFTPTPPTQSEARFRMELCNDQGLTLDSDLAEEDQCPSGTRLCLTLLNHKESSDEPVRITTVIPIWPADLPDHDIELEPLGKNGREGLRILVAGADFAGTTQHVNLTLLCPSSSSSTTDPKFLSYTTGTLNLEWTTSEACPRSEDDDAPLPNDPSNTTPSDGNDKSKWGFWGLIKFLFWTSILLLLSYFIIGMFYNHQQYSAKGWDLVPHRDFWREVPVMLSDLFSHLFAGLRGASGSGGGGSGRGGYSSLG